MTGTYRSPAETGLYYLQSRYYDSEICRFINADGFASTGQGLLGSNMFAYCLNNPNSRTDSNGNWPRWITALAAAVTAVGAVVATVVAAPVVAVGALAVSAVLIVTYSLQSYHYDDRKEKNTDIPQTRDEAKEAEWYGPGTEPYNPSADCHQYTSKDRSNVKYVSPDGKREAIYNSKGILVTDSRDIGTYNYSPPDSVTGSIGHFFADMLPWYIFGNDDRDPGPLINEIVRVFQ